MGRRKLKMELIAKEKARLVTYHTRKQCLMRKAYEFSTLCDVETCVILYGPKLQDVGREVETWPKNREQVCAVVDKYISTEHSDKRGKRNQGVADYYTNPMKKLRDQIVKVKKENMELRFLKWDDRLELLPHDHLRFVEAELDYMLESAKQRQEMLRNQQLLTTVSFQKLPQLVDFHGLPPFGFPSNNFSSMLSTKTDDVLQFHSDYFPYCDQVVSNSQYYSPGSHMVPSYAQNLQMKPEDFHRIQASQVSDFINMNAHEMNFLKYKF